MQRYKSLTTGTELHGEKYTYRIEKVLGQGTFGITYMASLSLVGTLGVLPSFTTVAIKEFFIDQLNGRENNAVTLTQGNLFKRYKRKFIREAMALQKLDHPHIMKVLELIEYNNTVYYVMEYCSGGNLDNYIIENRQLNESEALQYVAQIADALSFMHRNHILHLDLKPSNIVLRENGDAVLIDFGLAKQYDDNGHPETSTTIGSGTPGYAPIEQSNFQSDKNSFPVTMDIYALGATLFKMLTGTPPPLASEIFEEGFPAHWLQVKGVSQNTIHCIRRAMSVARKERFQTVEEFAQKLGTQVQEIFTIAPTEETKSTASPSLYYEEARKHYHNKNFEQALILFKKCGKMGHNESLYMVGHCYEYGKGVNKSLAAAYKWYNLAAQRGHREARRKEYELQRIKNKSQQEPIHKKNTNTQPRKVSKTRTFLEYVMFFILGILVIIGTFIFFYILLNSIK